MLRLSESLINLPVLSLRTNTPIATATRMVINPNNLRIEGWFVQEPGSSENLILTYGNIRDIISAGIVVNDREDLSTVDELVRLKPIIDIDFELVGKAVTTESDKKLGKVADFAVETEAFIVKKLTVSQSIMKSISGGGLTIDRTQIVEITDKRIIVEEPTESSKAPAVATV